jgi:hypothetical protein
LPKTGAYDLLTGLSDMLPLDPVGALDSGWAQLTPDAVKPFFQYVTNKNFMGQPVYKNDPYGQNEWRPPYTKVRRNKAGEAFIPEYMIDMAKVIDNSTGGDGTREGVVSPNPEIINHIARGYIGGLYDIAIRTGDWVAKGIDADKDVKFRDTPFSSFFTSADDLQTNPRGLNNNYFEASDKIKEVISQGNDYTKRARAHELSVTELAKNLTEINYYEAKKLNALINEIAKREKMLGELDEEKYETANKIVVAKKKELIERYKEGWIKN